MGLRIMTRAPWPDRYHRDWRRALSEREPGRCVEANSLTCYLHQHQYPASF